MGYGVGVFFPLIPTSLKITLWSVKVYFDPIVDDKASFVAPVNFHCRVVSQKLSDSLLLLDTVATWVL